MAWAGSGTSQPLNMSSQVRLQNGGLILSWAARTVREMNSSPNLSTKPLALFVVSAFLRVALDSCRHRGE